MADWIEVQRQEWNERFDRLADRLRLLQSVTPRVNGIARAIVPADRLSTCPLWLLRYAGTCRQ